MGLFKNLFRKEETKVSGPAAPKGFHALEVKEVAALTSESVKVSFIVPEELRSRYTFIPGQYLNLSVRIDGKEERRSYSICSGADEAIAVAIKRVEGGKISGWAKDSLHAGSTVFVSEPMGSFRLEKEHRNVVAFSAGSGITPILAMAKSLEKNDGKLRLFYGNRTMSSTMFAEELTELKNTVTTYYLTGETLEGQGIGQLNKESIMALLKSDLQLLRSDAFFLCGPEEMIHNAVEALTVFGVPKTKIHYELFTTPVLFAPEQKPETGETWSGDSRVTVILDDEKIDFTLNSEGKTILDAVNNEGYDAPYSCRGGVCSTCRAKVLSGKVKMNMNYALTDEEVAEGVVLTCQSHPASETLVISYDE